MAILNGPYASGMSGKVGEVVAAKTTGGRTAIRAYKRQIKNPKTLRQRVSRAKLAKASELAAMLSDALKIGFAKATVGTEMYPRNLFVKSIVQVSTGIMTVSGENVTVDYEKIPVSEASGFSPVPVVTQGTPDTGYATKFILSNADEFQLEAGESLGLVIVAFDPVSKVAMVKVGLASEGVQMTEAEIAKVSTGVMKGFVKVIPEGLNGVPSNDIPWKYPSRTSASVTVS